MTATSSPGSIPISTIVGDPVARVVADATVAEVAKALVACDVGVVVIGDDPRPTALVSERDVVRAVAAGRDAATLPATDIASTRLVWCAAEATVNQVAAQMMDHYIRHVLVDRDGALVGIVSARDLLGVYNSYGADPDLAWE
ncbi:CBS domain-containing protein [Mycobacterium shigaense]|uniref:CBS domain-containing protein n=1 Tax=Mycobacterium shigaense TaxID=722731 RepID=UPI000BBB48B3|nr:CBS domain-containing protein [Mycobacterium shigaense]MEA1121863.1 CBS domain-containing protein [Mycobacterium shigaense]PRI16104.1 histidine kinase [Mycobacterium shigaense]